MEVLESISISESVINDHLKKSLISFPEKYIKYLENIKVEVKNFPVIEDEYSRNRIYHDQNIEVVVAVWSGKFIGIPHNHGDSYCIFSVIEGAVLNIDVSPNDRLTGYSIIKHEHLMIGDVKIIKNSNEFHLIKNILDTPSVTLNIYCPPISSYKKIHQ